MENYYERYWKEGKGESSVWWNAKLLRKKFAFIEPYIHGKIIDIGCGDGIFTSYLKTNHFDVMGCDISETAIKTARKKWQSNITFLVKDFSKETNFMNESFDCIVCFEVIEHIYDTENFLKEINRVLKRGGYLFITTPDFYWLKNFVISFMWSDHFKSNNPHIRFYTLESLKKALNKFGFEIIEHKPDRGWFGLFSKSMFVTTQKVE